MAETHTSIKFVRDFRIKPKETSDLLQTARDTSELKHTTVFNNVQSVSHNQMTLTSWRAPGCANTHQTNCHRNDVYRAICLKLSMLVCIKLIANIRLFQRNRICTFDFIDKVHELFVFPSYYILSFLEIGPPVLEKKIFEWFLPYMGVAAILVM